MKITANGETTELEQAVNISELLVILKVATPEYVTVLINDEIINASEFESTLVKDGDVIEFLYYMGGGAANELH